MNKPFTVQGIVTGGDECRIDPHTPPGAIFIDGLDLVRYLDIKKLDDYDVKISIHTPDQILGPYKGTLFIQQGYGDENGAGVGTDLLEMEGLEGEYINFIDIILAELGVFIVFNCEEL